MEVFKYLHFGQNELEFINEINSAGRAKPAGIQGLSVASPQRPVDFSDC
jgi:hypothetical protein